MIIRESRRFRDLRERIAASPEAILVLVVLVIFMDMMIYGLLIPVFPEYAPRLGVDESILGIIFGVYAAMLFLFSVPMGLLSDRVGRRPLIVAGMILLALATALFGFSTTVTRLFVARTVQGISAAATWSAGLALLADTTDPSRLGERMGISLSAVGLGTVLGPVVGGLLFEYLGYTATFLVPAVVVATVGLLVLAIPVRSCRREESQERAGMLPRRCLLPLAACAATTVGVSGTYGVLDPYLPVYLHAMFSASPTTIGLVFAVLAIAAAIAQPMVGRIYDRHGGSRYLIGGGLLLSGAAIFAAMHAPTLPLVTAAIVALGVTLSSALVPVMPIMASIYRDQGSQGVAYGMYNTFFSIGLSTGPFAGAALLGRYPLATIFLLQAGVLGIIGVLEYLLIGKLGWR
ncbi:MAG TPA: MFS transporter [Candidatus Methanoculleus thermohydrogenotrophicum]|jgi:multidrug resistance protein|nr:MFS transporter [Candidatus Methanoculleus thermohydrogenotrophicum]NLM81473.1 MFS transporter [Candidatus Methanoculleus thermohydrogenotrophicum]HOB18178.1 MFS transporter [Candidatus Methanoculleus thermohydrogenotrophicum]HPZ38310.1 MFS transporter [Candidatus Methanoculleus thermohydrogenotrophicum]HQC91578.1 MFS transporter [Candidatus Methanoculleus thermohydrogenotrophicum]